VTSTRRQRCRNPKCPCVEHQIPPRTTWHSAEGVPPLPGSLVGFIHRVQDETGARRVYFCPSGRSIEQPLPDTVPPSWQPAIDRAHRFVTRQKVNA
jgi:hypothetical protein